MRNIGTIIILTAAWILFPGCTEAGKKADISNLYVSVDGKKSSSGTQTDPMSFERALELVSEQLKEHGLPKKGVKISVLGGHYRFLEPYILGKEFQGTEKNPILIQAMEGEEVLFDGSVLIDNSGFTKVSDPDEKSRLVQAAAGEILVTNIDNEILKARFSDKMMLNLSFNGKEYLPSVFPNEGYATFKIETLSPEVYPPAVPVGEQDYGIRAGNPPYQEPGKPQSWKGTLDEPRGARAGFDEKEDEMGGTWEQWEKEINRNNTRNQLTGFIEANWLLSSQAIYAASGADKCVHLSRALGYGWAWRSEKPFRVFGLLCELDQGGEWHFDPLTNRLFIYPLEPLNSESEISLSVADGFMKLDACSHVQIIGLSVGNVGSGTVYEIGGNNNLVASASVSTSTATGIYIGGKDNSVLACDLYDLDFHMKLEGGLRAPTEITPGNNLVENCQFYQENYKHEKVNILMNGVGNTFRHNLVHNSLGQALVVNGNDHLIEFCEFFNVGYDEGDGGAIYSGADLAGFGNTYQYNFFHHLMGVPGKVERSGIHLDDGQSGATCVGNVFFKSAAKGIHSFGGAGHTILDNVNLEGFRGIRMVQSLGMKYYLLQKELEKNPEHDRINTKENYIGRAERFVGKEGWKNPPWSEKYPLFNEIMSDTGVYGRFWPIKHRIEDNCYYANAMPIDPGDRRIDPEARETWILTGQKEVEPGDFEDYAQMNFQFKTGEGFPDIPFSAMGLVQDEYRSWVPDKTLYRNAIKDFFDGITSMPGTKKQFDSSKFAKQGS